MGSKVKFDLRFELSNLNHHGIDVYIASKSLMGGFCGHGGLQMASIPSKVKSDLTFEISNLNYPGIYVHVTSNSHLCGL